jgi:acyl carrier protein
VDGISKLRREIGQIFLERFDTRLASDSLDLIEARLVDSVRIFDLVLVIEERFGLSLPFEELEIEDFRSVARLAELVARSLPGAA